MHKNTGSFQKKLLVFLAICTAHSTVGRKIVYGAGRMLYDEIVPEVME